MSAEGPAPTMPAAPIDAAQAVTNAVHELLWVSSPAEVRQITVALIRELGGDVGPADTDPADCLPIDVSYGDGPPLVPLALSLSVARLQLERHLPAFVEDARRAVDLAARQAMLQRDASIDGLTGIANRRSVGRALGRLRPGDVVVMVDLDHFKRFNDTEGHAAGDEILRAFGAALRDELRARDFCGRYGGEEFLLILADTADPGTILDRLRRAWAAARPRPITFSGGWATVPAAPIDPAVVVSAADRALYRSKAGGRDRALPATEEDFAP